MRTLKFIVEGQIIRPDPSCDFSGLVPGSEGYLRAEFSFSKDWVNTIKVVSFSRHNTEFTPKALSDGVSCEIPPDALKNRYFQISVLGKRGDFVLTTNKVTIQQNGGQT